MDLEQEKTPVGIKTVTQPTVTVPQQWDLVAFATDDREKMGWALDNFFEPFATTTKPKQNMLAGQMEIEILMWFKRPAMKNSNTQPPEGKSNVIKPS